METMSRDEERILGELREISPQKLPTVLRLIKLLKDDFLSISKSRNKKANALLDVDDFAIETGIPDLAKNHDHYLYGVGKNE